MKTITRNFEDINFTVVMHEGKQNNAYVSFKAYEIVGKYENGNFVYYEKNSKSSNDTTEDIENAEVYLSGDIKWDGCSNMNFDEQERVMLHFCSKEDAANIGILMSDLYDIAAELMPDNADNLE